MMVNFLKVSIPQAVSTVATINIPGEEPIHELRVSIPQAVSTVATPKNTFLKVKNGEFQYRKR